MLPYQETELKLTLRDPSFFERIAADPFPGGAVPTSGRKASFYENTYYDTADRRLLTEGLMLRVRDTGEGLVATVKDKGTMSGGLFVRGEWNVPVAGEPISAGLFVDLPVGERLAQAVGPNALEPIFKTSFRRISMEVRSSDSVAEFAADSGEIIAGDKSAPLCELELELKSGEAAELIRLGAALAERCPLTVENRSKYARGLLLAGLSPDTRDGAQAPDAPLSGGTVRAVMTEQLVSALHAVFDREAQFISNPSDPETAHQLRVSLRRLRALLSFVKPALQPAAYGDAASRLRALANDFSALRELDVLLDSWCETCRAYPEHQHQANGLEALLRSERETEQARLMKNPASGAVTAALLNVWALFLGEIWTKKADGDMLEFAFKRMKKWTARFRADLKATPFKDLSKAHPLRILGKKIRYVQDALFEGDGGDDAPTIKNLKNYQNLLGLLCDAGRNTELLKGLLKAHPDPLIQSEGELLISLERQRFKDTAAALKKEAAKS